MKQSTQSRAAVLALSTGLSATCFAQQSDPKPAPEVHGKLTTTAGIDGDFSQLGELNFKLPGLRGKAAAEFLPSKILFGENINLGLDLNFGLLGQLDSEDLAENLNLGLGLRDGEVDLSRVSFKHTFSPHTYLGLTWITTPKDDQIFAEGGFALSDELFLQGAFDDEGNFRSRFVYQEDKIGFSLGGGMQNERGVFNASVNTDSAWLAVSGGENIPLQVRGVLGNIPANRSDLYAAFSRPGVNDLSLFPDQTVRNSIGANPTFGLLALAPDAFLGKQPGDLVLDLQYVEDRLVTGRVVGRLGDLAFFEQSWIAAGVGHNLDIDQNVFTVETGSKLGPGDIRLRTEIDDEGKTNFGVMFSIRW